MLEYLREEERLDEKRRAAQRDRMFEGNRLGGLILVVVGGVLSIALQQIIHELPIYLFGLIPIGIGIVLLLTSLKGARR